MQFGLRKAAQTFQRFINEILHGLEFCFTYIDDILIASKDADEHERHLREVFERLQKHGLTVNWQKYTFGAEKVEFLGYEVCSEGTRPLPKKVQAISDYQKPKTVRELRRFLGIINFYRRFLPNASSSITRVFKKPKEKR